MAFNHPANLAIGEEVEIELPGAAGVVMGRVARQEGGIVGIAFREDEIIMARVDRVLSDLSERQSAAA